MTKKKSENIKICKCTCCGEEKKMNINNFYKSYSVIYKSSYENRMTICKECVLKLAENFKNTYGNEYKGLYELCKLLDIYYEKNIYDSAKKQAEGKNSNPYQIYFQKILSLPQNKNKTFIDSSDYDRQAIEKNIEEEIGRDVTSFWGSGFSQSDYNFLEEEYKNLTTRYECDSYAQEVLFQEIAFQRLDIKKKRVNGSSVDKEIKTLQDLLGSSGIKPVQENESASNDQTTFGTLIKKYENERPIPKPWKEWEDVDGIKKYISIWFLGHLCSMLGIENDYSQMYKDEINKFTVEKAEYEEDNE